MEVDPDTRLILNRSENLALKRGSLLSGANREVKGENNPVPRGWSRRKREKYLECP
jgi:hypothetical protein